MKIEIQIQNKLGLHARASAKLCQIAAQHESEVFIAKNGRSVNAKSIMGVMMLAASQGTILELSAYGTDENTVITAIKELVDNRFGESE